jgi:hypothetical protein
MRLSNAGLPAAFLFLAGSVFGQALNVPWSGYGHDAQHTALSPAAAQPLTNIHWSTPVDLNAPASGDIFAHYGSPMVSEANTVLVPVKTGSTDGFQVNAFNGKSGTLLYTLSTAYTLPPHAWTPSFAATLSLRNRLYYAGPGGTVYYRDRVDSPTGPTGQIAFYGNALYAANQGSFDSTVQISTPLTADRHGDIFFGFVVQGSNPANLVSGIARIGANGEGAWVSAQTASGGDPSIAQVTLNCAPALSNDQHTLYFAVSTGAAFGAGYLVSVNSTSLAPVAQVRLLDPRGGLATVSPDSTATPMVGPDGDVYYGVLENNCCASHNDRGWMLHFNSTLAQTKIPGSFGWDTTPAVVPAEAVASYRGSSTYLILTKYNNYAGAGSGDGVNKVAVLDPNAATTDPYGGAPAQTMQEVIAIVGVTPNPQKGFPNAVTEWCINTAAVDPSTRSAIVNSEDGVVYRWDFTTNTLSQRKTLTPGRGEAYTPTAIGPDGTVFAINNATLFAVGR